VAHAHVAVPAFRSPDAAAIIALSRRAEGARHRAVHPFHGQPQAASLDDAMRYNRCAHTYFSVMAGVATVTFWLNQRVLNLGEHLARYPGGNVMDL
jgi:hypothetical protein